MLSYVSMCFLAARRVVLHDMVRCRDSVKAATSLPPCSAAVSSGSCCCTPPLLGSSASLTTHDRSAAKLTSRLVASSVPLCDGEIVSLYEPSLPSDCLLA